MADIYRAFQFLNESLELNLTDEILTQSEMEMKRAWADERNHSIGDPDDWEFFAHLVPRSGDKTLYPPKLPSARLAKD